MNTAQRKIKFEIWKILNQKDFKLQQLHCYAVNKTTCPCMIFLGLTDRIDYAATQKTGLPTHLATTIV